MTYEYACGACKFRFDVIKSYKDIDRNENCPGCGEFAVREFVPTRVHIHGAKVEHAEYNPALGCVVRDKKHRSEICKERGLVEIGNDWTSPSAMVDKDDKDRAAKLDKRIEESV